VSVPYQPLHVACPPPPDGCGQPPGERCRSLVIGGRPYLRRPHAARVTRARLAEAHRDTPRLPAGVSDAWTCPECARSYWPPAEWEPELWPPVRRVAQSLHAARHAAERADRP
jgi:hypothetical protein